MAYYLRQDKKKKGTYLQMYESYWDKEKKQPRSRNIESFGYVSDLISDEIPDPVSYYQKYVEKRTGNTQILLLIKHAHGHSLSSLKKTSVTSLLLLFFQS